MAVAKRVALFTLLSLLALPAAGQIYNWNTGTVIPGTEGITPGPGMNLPNWNQDDHNLRFADLSGGLNLHGSTFKFSWLDYSRFTGADLTEAVLYAAKLIGADFSGAIVTGTNLSNTTSQGFTKEQLYSTASYQAGDLSGIKLAADRLSGWNLANQNLTGADFTYARLAGADLSGATVAGARFNDTTTNGFAKTHLYSTASYQVGNLSGIGLDHNNLTGWNFANQNLTDADFGQATLTGADLSGATVVGTDFFDTTSRGFTKEQLYSTASYQAGNLSGTWLGYNDLTGWNLANQNLTNANLAFATLTGVDLNGAALAWANLSHTTSSGFTKEQLYSTASYQSGNLAGIKLDQNDLTGWDLAHRSLSHARFNDATLTGVNLNGANLTGAIFVRTDLSHADLSGAELSSVYFSEATLIGVDLRGAALRNATLTGVDLSRADARGARFLTADQLASAITDNLILPDGHIAGLDLGAGETLKVRDYAGGIAVTVDDEFLLDPAAALELVFADAEWGSTISLADGVVADLGGTLRLDFTLDADLESLVGTTFDLFHWNGGLPRGAAFDQVLWPTWAAWDISDLYINGTATLTGVPEPATAGLLLLGGLLLARRRTKAS